MMTHYAHTRDGHPEADWEPLSRHLAEVEAGAGTRGQRFGVGTLAALAGRLHDLGKYRLEFQAYLRGKVGRVDHSSAGAAYASRLSGPLGRILAHVIAAHHAGLQDDLFKDEGRLDKARAYLPGVEQAARGDGVALPGRLEPPGGFIPSQGEQGFQFALLIRMIFSCLIDADRRAAAAFDASFEKPLPPSTPPAATISALRAELQDWMARQTHRASDLNQLRNDVLHHAVGKADQPRGVFTLTVPTGGGKTLTSLAFALAHAEAHGLDRVIVVIPFTSIIEQTAAVYRTALGPLADQVLEHHSGFDMSEELAAKSERIGPDRLKLSMATWDRPIIVTTAVQFFESLFSNRPSRCRKLHAIARSVVVLDEAQTMPLALLRPCVAALKELPRNYGGSVVLCTATQPALNAPPEGSDQGFKGGFVDVKELAPDVTGLFAALRRVVVRDIGVQSNADLAERLGQREQGLCIVNQRAHARDLFAAIRHLPGARHLSTCMHAVHRMRLLAEIREDLTAGRPCRVISTSLIEAGVDIDFPTVLRASAGLDQIAQAAGRCNREGKRAAADSEVLVFKATEHDVIQSLKKNAESGAEILRSHAADPFSPDAIQAFFEQLYWRRQDGQKDGLDEHGVLAACEGAARDLDFPFASIAGWMRFIDDAMLPVIVPVEDDGKVTALLTKLRFVEKPGGIARELQRFTVGVPQKVRSELLAKGLAETVRAQEFGDQFVVLLNLDLYKPDIGLDWREPSFIAAERLIVG